ncbi:unnamed protein product [Ilex paraguariensis]|uniref:Late embryogenesis abundant protein n=1 Tax=Ilex paraguariensis TaxID=185542 RepID=A0ABC8TSD3_9AQUA
MLSGGEMMPRSIGMDINGDGPIGAEAGGQAVADTVVTKGEGNRACAQEGIDKAGVTVGIVEARSIAVIEDEEGNQIGPGVEAPKMRAPMVDQATSQGRASARGVGRDQAAPCLAGSSSLGEPSVVAMDTRHGSS